MLWLSATFPQLGASQTCFNTVIERPRSKTPLADASAAIEAPPAMVEAQATVGIDPSEPEPAEQEDFEGLRLQAEIEQEVHASQQEEQVMAAVRVQALARQRAAKNEVQVRRMVYQREVEEARVAAIEAERLRNELAAAQGNSSNAALAEARHLANEAEAKAQKEQDEAQQALESQELAARLEQRAKAEAEAAEQAWAEAEAARKEVAAIKIQAAARGKVARKKVRTQLAAKRMERLAKAEATEAEKVASAAEAAARKAERDRAAAARAQKDVERAVEAEKEAEAKAKKEAEEAEQAAQAAEFAQERASTADKRLRDAEDATVSATEALDEAKEAGDPEEIARAEAALKEATKAAAKARAGSQVAQQLSKEAAAKAKQEHREAQIAKKMEEKAEKRIAKETAEAQEAAAKAEASSALADEAAASAAKEAAEAREMEQKAAEAAAKAAAAAAAAAAEEEKNASAADPQQSSPTAEGATGDVERSNVLTHSLYDAPAPTDESVQELAVAEVEESLREFDDDTPAIAASSEEADGLVDLTEKLSKGHLLEPREIEELKMAAVESAEADAAAIAAKLEAGHMLAQAEWQLLKSAIMTSASATADRLAAKIAEGHVLETSEAEELQASVKTLETVDDQDNAVRLSSTSTVGTAAQTRAGGADVKQERAEGSEMDLAASKVQAVQRGRFARRDAGAKRVAKQERVRMEEMEVAATKVQAVQRGRFARKDTESARLSTPVATKRPQRMKRGTSVGVQLGLGDDLPSQDADQQMKAPSQPGHALFILNMQNDYIDGTLALRYTNAHHEGFELVPAINSIRRKNDNFNMVVLAKTWLPEHHCSFYESNVGREIPKRPKSADGRMRVKIAQKLRDQAELNGENAPAEDRYADDDLIIISQPEEGYVAGMRRNAMEFDSTDVDGDRELTLEEFGRMVREREEGEHDDEEIKERFEAIDQDGGGTISMNEYVYFALCECLIRSGQRVMDLFKMWDDDNSGLIDKAEFRRAIKAMGFAVYVNDAEIDMVYDEFDADKLGAIDYHELNAALRRVKLPTKSLKKRERLKTPLPEKRIRLKTNEEASDFIRNWLAENKQRVIDLFKEWDEDGNGTIDRREFRHGLAALGIKMRSDKVEALFETLDKDRSGEIDYNELTIGLQGKKKLKDMPQGPRHFRLPPLHEKYTGDIADAEPYDLIYIESPHTGEALPLTLLPRHCEQFTWGSRVHDQLLSTKDDVIVTMGSAAVEDGEAVFSAFRNVNEPPDAESELPRLLQSKGVTHVYLCGLALDYCVVHTALDAAAAGFVVTVVEDVCRGTSTLETKRKMKLLDEAGIKRITADALPEHRLRCSLKDVELAKANAPTAKRLADMLVGCPSYAKIPEPDELAEKLAAESEVALEMTAGKGAAKANKAAIRVNRQIAELRQKQLEGRLTSEELHELQSLEALRVELGKLQELAQRHASGELTMEQEEELKKLHLKVSKLIEVNQEEKASQTFGYFEKRRFDELKQRKAEGKLSPEDAMELQRFETRLGWEPDEDDDPVAAADDQSSTAPSRVGTAERNLRAFDTNDDGKVDMSDFLSIMAAVDKDGDGQLDADEFAAFTKAVAGAAPAAARSEPIPVARDGQLSAEELRLLREQIGQGLDPNLSEQERERIVSHVMYVLQSFGWGSGSIDSQLTPEEMAAAEAAKQQALAEAAALKVKQEAEAAELKAKQEAEAAELKAKQEAEAAARKARLEAEAKANDLRLGRTLFHNADSLPPIKGASPRPQPRDPSPESDPMHSLRVAALAHGFMDPRMARREVEAAISRREMQWQLAIEDQLRYLQGRGGGRTRKSSPSFPRPPGKARGLDHSPGPRGQRHTQLPTTPPATAPRPRALAPVPLFMGAAKGSWAGKTSASFPSHSLREGDSGAIVSAYGGKGSRSRVV